MLGFRKSSFIFNENDDSCNVIDSDIEYSFHYPNEGPYKRRKLSQISLQDVGQIAEVPKIDNFNDDINFEESSFLNPHEQSAPFVPNFSLLPASSSVEEEDEDEETEESEVEMTSEIVRQRGRKPIGGEGLVTFGVIDGNVMERRGIFRQIKEGLITNDSPIYQKAEEELKDEFERVRILAEEAPAPNPKRDVKNPEDWNVLRLVCYRYNK